MCMLSESLERANKEQDSSVEIHVEKQIWVTSKRKKCLFGKKCREQISKTVKAHKQSKELLENPIFKDAANGKCYKMLQQKRFIRKRFLPNIILWAIYFWSNRPTINLKKINQNILSSPQTISNGESAITERYPQAERLHMLSGSKRCIVLHPLTEESKKVGGGGGGAISIPVSMLWIYPCPLLFY